MNQAQILGKIVVRVPNLGPSTQAVSLAAPEAWTDGDSDEAELCRGSNVRPTALASEDDGSGSSLHSEVGSRVTR
jgi:hypothetical protein